MRSRTLVGCGLLSLLIPGLPAAPAEAQPQRVEFVLDASGSMWGQIEGEPKIASAKRVMNDVIRDLEIQPESALGLTVYGHRRKGDCADIERFAPVSAENKDDLLAAVQGINPKGKTPLAGTLETLGGDLRRHEGSSSVVVVTDGIESCGGRPCEVARQLREGYGLDVVIHVVGFDIAEQQEQLECIAKAGGGRYFAVADATELSQALKEVQETLETAQAEPSEAPRQRIQLGVAQIVVEPLTLEGFRDVEQFYIAKAGTRIDFAGFGGEAVVSHGEPQAVEPGDYTIVYEPAERCRSVQYYSVLKPEVSVAPGETVAVDPDEEIAGVVIEEVPGLDVHRFYVIPAGGRRDVAGRRVVDCVDGFGEPLMVTAGRPYDILLQQSEDSGVVAILEDVAFEPGQLTVVGP